MKTGEVIKGRVSAMEKVNKDWFFLNDGLEKHRPIDMNTVDKCVYDG